MWNCTHFRYPTDEQLRHVDIYFLATKIICSLSTLNCIFVLQCLTFEWIRNNILKVLWTYLHVGPLERVVAFFPSPPCHSFGIDLTWKVQAIQIGGVTIFVPPGASIIYGTVGRILVVITIPGTECHTTVRS